MNVLDNYYVEEMNHVIKSVENTDILKEKPIFWYFNEVFSSMSNCDAYCLLVQSGVRIPINVDVRINREEKCIVLWQIPKRSFSYDSIKAINVLDWASRYFSGENLDSIIRESIQYDFNDACAFFIDVTYEEILNQYITHLEFCVSDIHNLHGVLGLVISEYKNPGVRDVFDLFELMNVHFNSIEDYKNFLENIVLPELLTIKNNL